MTSRYTIAIGILALAAITPELISRRSAHPAPSASQPPIEATIVDTGGLAIARRAIELHAQKKYAEARGQYDLAAQRLPSIADWLDVFAASSSSYLGDTVDVTRRLADEDPALTEFAWRTPIRARLVAGDTAGALAEARAATESGSLSKRATAWYVISEIARDGGRRAEQRAALLRALQMAPGSDAAADAARILTQFSDLASAERLMVGRALMAAGETRRAIKDLRTYLAASSDAQQRAAVQYEIGRALFNLGEYPAAARELIAIPASSERAPDARFLAARAEHRAKAGSGNARFKRIAETWPASGAATRSLFYLADLAQDNGNLAEAISYFRRAGAKSAPTEDVAEALMRLGAILYTQNKFEDAARVFDGYRARFKSGTYYEQATYWAAEAHAKAGNQEVARERLNAVDAKRSLSFYDIRASEQLKHDPLEHLGNGPDHNPELRKAVEPALDRWALLRELDWNVAAATELSRLRRRYTGKTDALYEIAEGMQIRGQANAAINLGNEIRQQGTLNKRLLRILYPWPYRELIEQQSKARGLDPYFVAALMRQESWFNPRAISGAGAVGLMQIMPATGRQLARGEDVGVISVEKLQDPAVNIRLGTKFLADIMSTYGSRSDAVLAAYNAGPSRMDRWRKFPEFADRDLFAERIPYDETRNYVKVIRVNTSIYRALYGAGTL